MNQFIIYNDMIADFQELSNEEAGAALKALLALHMGESINDQLKGALKGMVNFAWRSMQRMREISEKRRASVAKRWAAREKVAQAEHATDTIFIQNTYKADTEKEKEKEKEKDSFNFSKYNPLPLHAGESVGTGKREDGTNPRAQGTNPRAKGTNPRALQHDDLVQTIEGCTDHMPLRKALSDFNDMRNAIRKPLTEHALLLLVKRLESLAGDNTELKIAILEQSTRNSWQDVYELKQERKYAPNTQNASRGGNGTASHNCGVIESMLYGNQSHKSGNESVQQPLPCALPMGTVQGACHE